MGWLSSRVVQSLILLYFSCVIVTGNMAPDSNFNLSSIQGLAFSNDDYSCSKDTPCKLGCCGPLDPTGHGVCGFGPEYCGKGCTSDCGRKSECDPGWGKDWSSAPTCPLNVCCSKFGFCGTSADFCGDKKVVSPECNGKSATAKVVGYWEAWNNQRPCGHMDAKDIPLGYYTHINFAFALINPTTFRIADMDPTTGQRYRELAEVKIRQPSLQVFLAIGGWSMNDPGPYRTVFSDLAASTTAQDSFFESLVSFLMTNNFDGVDLDWEYPVADDRGGRPEDYTNFVTLLRRLREHLNQTGRYFGISITLPASYWYLRGFDLVHIEPFVDWFNVMTYDIHGTWDKHVHDFEYRAYAHTNLTEINAGLELLWRNNVNPERVVMGVGFYGRSFTMESPSCMAPGCRFRDGGRKGECTGQEGVLSASEIHKILNSTKDVSIQFDKQAAVKIATWDMDQWVSWDDKETLKLKIDYANRRCLGGTMVWAIDLDDGVLIDALGEALGKQKRVVGSLPLPLFPDLIIPPEAIPPNDDPRPPRTA
ncbi:glycoside hydrolase superfamily [Aspergillus ambiguus]|uniref:glycoside hydrolase superfamily n=1 Tax=Aspergillus ambiguus TaxID=176160 RepID=UPI003CCE2440